MEFSCLRFALGRALTEAETTSKDCRGMYKEGLTKWILGGWG